LTPGVRTRRGWFLYPIVIVFLVVVVEGAFVALRLRSATADARARLAQGATALSEVHLRAARRDFEVAQAASQSATEVTGRPSFELAAMLPGIRADLAAVQAMSVGLGLAAEAGMQAVGAADSLQAGSRGLASVYDDGRVQLRSLRRAEPFVRHAERLLSKAVSELQYAPDPYLSFTREALGLARLRLGAARESARKSAAAMDMLPSVLGTRREGRYLLAFQALGEARGTGGLIGFYGVLHASRGRLELGRIGPISELASEPIKNVEGPRWFERRYASLSGLRLWQSANLSPDFPAVAQVLLNMYEAVAGQPLDGVIAMDPVALQELLAATGPIQGDGLPVEVGAENAADVIMRDAYTSFGPSTQGQNSYLASLLRAFWDKVETGAFDVPTMIGAVAASAAGGHLKMYVADPYSERAMVALEADGGLPTDEDNVQLVYHNNLGGNKVDYYLRRTVETTVWLDELGDARVKTTSVMHNAAPPGPKSPLLGPAVRGDPPGLNAALVSFLAPKGARFTDFRIAGKAIEPWTGRERGFPVAGEVATIPAGGTTKASVTYRVPDAASVSLSEGRFSMTLLPHTTPEPDEVELVIVPPYGYAVDDVVGGEAMPDGTVRLSGALDEEKSVTIELTRD
jgi:hypothetical protein